jgi:peptidoglycan hydrolase CwlO-like protein
MNVADLEAKIADVQARFDDALKNKNEWDTELTKLQGEFRALDNLKNELKEKPDATDKTVKATKKSPKRTGK